MNGDPIAATNQIGVYNLLYWTMNLVTPGVGNINPSGIIPHTRPNVAAFAANTVAINGPVSSKDPILDQDNHKKY